MNKKQVLQSAIAVALGAFVGGLLALELHWAWPLSIAIGGAIGFFFSETAWLQPIWAKAAADFKEDKKTWVEYVKFHLYTFSWTQTIAFGIATLMTVLAGIALFCGADIPASDFGMIWLIVEGLWLGFCGIVILGIALASADSAKFAATESEKRKNKEWHEKYNLLAIVRLSYGYAKIGWGYARPRLIQAALFCIVTIPYFTLSAPGILIQNWPRIVQASAQNRITCLVTAALGALFLYALDPTLLAHSYLVTTDAARHSCGVFVLFNLF